MGSLQVCVGPVEEEADLMLTWMGEDTNQKCVGNPADNTMCVKITSCIIGLTQKKKVERLQQNQRTASGLTWQSPPLAAIQGYTFEKVTDEERIGILKDDIHFMLLYASISEQVSWKDILHWFI